MPVLDASFLIDIEQGTAKAVQLADRLAQERRSIWIPVVSWMEYVARYPARLQAQAGDALASMGTVVPFDAEMARLGAAIQQQAMREGRRRGWNDTQVAATAMHLREPVIASDGDFDGIVGLDVVRP